MRVLSESVLVFRYHFKLLVREPIWVAIALVQPLFYLALFGPLLEPLTRVKGFPGGNSWQVFVPGLLIQLGIFGSLFVGFGLIGEIRDGVVERMRVTPASRFALLFGRVLRDTLVLSAQAILLSLVAAIFGLRVPLAGALATLGIIMLLGMSLSSFSYAAALRLKSEDVLAQLLNTISIPALLLSGILLPMSLAPRWLYLLSRLNPFSYVVDGARAAFRDDFSDFSLPAGFAAALLLAGSGLYVATRIFTQESA